MRFQCQISIAKVKLSQILWEKQEKEENYLFKMIIMRMIAKIVNKLTNPQGDQ